ncbi:MAG: CBS domain-containing protein [Methanobacteriaceae archaeon]
MKIKNIMSENVVSLDKDQNICDALRVMKKNRISRIPVVNTNENNEKELVGIATETDIAIKLGSSKYGNLAPSHFHLSTVMTKEVLTVDEDMSLNDTANLILENNISGMPVMSGSEVVGMITKTDFIETCKGKAYERITAEEVMSSDIIAVSSQDRLIHARRTIIDSGVGRLLVSEDDELSGIITSKDIGRAMISFRKHVPDNHKQAQLKNILVEEVMSKTVKSVSYNDTIAEVADAMIKEGVNGFPVVNEENQVIGIITKTDLLGLMVEMES